MPITINNSQDLNIFDTTSYTVPAGSDRIVVIVVHIRSAVDNVDITGVTLGAQAATALAAEESFAWSNKVLTTRIFYIKEADIPSGAQTLTVSGANVDEYATVFTLFNVDQAATPYLESPADSDVTLQTAAKTVTANFGANSGNFGVGVCINRSGDYNFTTGNGTITHNNGDSVSFFDGPFSQNDYHVRVMKHDSIPSDSYTTVFTVDYDDSGTDANGHPTLMCYAMAFQEVGAAISVTLDQSTLVPGGTISGSYSGFQSGTPPTSPIAISDGTNTITAAVTVTVSDNGDGAGTFTGTLPSLPAAGNSGSFILFGNVTATLDDA